jgi:mRNA interferase MazF
MPIGQRQPLRSRRSSLGGRNVGLECRLKRGEIWTGAAAGDYSGKPRPVVVLQHEHFETLDSVTICGFTSDSTELPMFRVSIEPSASNGLQSRSQIMVDKVMSVPKRKLGRRIGELGARDVARLNEALRTFLGLVG